MSFASLGLSEALVRAIEAAGYTEPTPVQQRAIPAVLQGRDLMVAAQTGTGKTGGFALPILEKLFPNGHPDKSQRHGPRQPRVLVLTPTRELAAQVHESFKLYARDLKFVSACVGVRTSTRGWRGPWRWDLSGWPLGNSFSWIGSAKPPVLPVPVWS